MKRDEKTLCELQHEARNKSTKNNNNSFKPLQNKGNNEVMYASPFRATRGQQNSSIHQHVFAYCTHRVHTKQYITQNYDQNHHLMSQKITTLLTSMLVQPLCDMLLTHCVSGACWRAGLSLLKDSCLSNLVSDEDWREGESLDTSMNPLDRWA